MMSPMVQKRNGGTRQPKTTQLGSDRARFRKPKCLARTFSAIMPAHGIEEARGSGAS